jgi:4-hydroxy-3-polyprenylbenzoate decarboxylase
MGYATLQHCIGDLESSGQLLRIEQPVSANLEIAEIQRRVYRAGGPALLFENVVGCGFPMLGNLFGTIERVRYMFRDSLERLGKLVSLQVDPADVLRNPRLYLSAPRSAWHARPKRVKKGPVLAQQTTLDKLPQLRSWPDDGGAYITLPQVYSEDPTNPGPEHSNLGMYRVQISGGDYMPNKEAGLHYQLNRGIAQHHAAAMQSGVKLPVNVFIGGPPAMTVAAVMPLPEGVSELTFAGVLGQSRVPMICRDGQLPIHAQADFCISGFIDPMRQLPEGPFGDHLGYYSLAHEFPVLRVVSVHHREGAVWPFTVVGRPPQEDTVFAELIHELVGPIIPKTIPGVQQIHAVDAAGIHPLLLAVGSERYLPSENHSRPRELLTLANAILGHGQLSLAKYLWILAGEDNPELDVRQVSEVLRHVLERVDFSRDLHFHTRTTMDTLDYSSGVMHEGSKLVIAAAGPPRRTLPVAIDSRLVMPEGMGLRNPRVCLPGILVVEGRKYSPDESGKDRLVERFAASYNAGDAINGFPLLVVVDDSEFSSRTLDNFLWTTFTRSDPAGDVYGIDSATIDKHWGCRGSLVIDARIKPHHAPPLVEDAEITRRVDQLAAPGRLLHGVI